MASKQNDNIDIANQNQKKQAQAGFGEFLYNPSTGEVLGRTGLGWLKLLVFYLIYYGCLAGFFAMMLAIFFINISVTVPKYYNEDGLMLDGARDKVSPGMGLRPLPDYETTLIAFQANKPETYNIYTDNIQTFLKSYQSLNARDDIRRKECVIGNGPNADEGCEFNPENQLGKCGKINAQGDLGYQQGNPCVLLKLNKIFGWVPKPIKCYTEDSCDVLTSDEMKWFKEVARKGESLVDLFNGHNVPTTCEGINPADKENILGVEYQPSGFGDYYYPYLNQRGYLAPLVGAQFNVTRGVLVMVRCRSWAQNIANDDFLSKEGAVHFELLVD